MEQIQNNTATIKLLLDNGFAVAFALVLLLILFYIIRISVKFMEQKEKRHVQENQKREEKYTDTIQSILSKYEQISVQTTATIDKITDAFQLFMNQNKDEMREILSTHTIIKSDLESIDKKLDIIHTTQKDLLEITTFKNKKKGANK